MSRPIIRNGLYGAAILVGINVIILLMFGVPEPGDYALGEIIGYTTIVVALIPVFFGIKQYRDRHLDGQIGFWKAVGVGIGVASFPSIVFALYNYIYVTWIDPDFTETYYEHAMQTAQAKMTAAEFQAYSAEMQAQQAMFTDPWVMTLVMFMTVFLIGVVIAAVSALVLQRKPSPAELA